MYARIINGNAPHWKNGISNAPVSNNAKRAMLIPLNFKSLNFKDIIDMLLTNKMAKHKVSMQTTQKLFKKESFSAARGMKPRKMAFAGVGRPMKVVACRSSMLKRANLTADRAGTSKAMNGRSSVNSLTIEAGSSYRQRVSHV